MDKFFILVTLCASMLMAGCFEHREAPARPVTANSLEEAVAARETTQKLVLNDTKLTSIPAELATMPQLETLHLRNTGITDFSGLGSVVNLKELDLSGVEMEAVPPELEAVAKLDRLYLSGCSLKKFPERLPKAIRYVNLDRNGITAVPDELPTSLLWLRLNFNSIDAIGPSIASLTKLKRIYLKQNRLASLPAEMAALVELEDVELARNRFTSFPEVLVSLPKLRNLDLRGNIGLTKLPENIGEMKSLRLLTLTGCSIPKSERDRIQAALPDCVINF